MNEKAIYRKTVKGQEEVATRGNQLSARVRTLLVMVDGKSSGAELLAKGKAFGDAAAFIEQLVAGGFIEAIEAAVAVPGAPDVSLEEIKQFASHQVIDRLGPTADALTLTLESAGTVAELGAALVTCRDAIQAVAGRRKAEEFWTAVAARMPQA
jgi:hypothetical protein